MLTEWAKILVPVFLAGQGLLVYWTERESSIPRRRRRFRISGGFGGWTEVREDPIDADVANTLRADRLLSRTYINRAARRAPLNRPVLVAWFQSQRAGASQPHSPRCASRFWMDTGVHRRVEDSTAAGPLTVNRYVVASRDQRAVVLYWYQTSRRAIAGEWASKFWLVADALRDRRTDTALVRIVVESKPGAEQLSTATATDFTRVIYPLLRDRLPRLD